ncbi:MAG: GntR family transcriptional regulator [Delftia acidovorans]|uniref:GntR family transcriptional regulator n=1 Tax=Delftia acidovorans TaxID=80866 RepID=A0A7T2S0S3_DELAC|nr:MULTISPECIES: GntR family transcriptional regulator [Delftia]MBB1648152.1 transcriptional regulator [Delftia sp. UME58]MBL8358785.1 GntR family transcriptional regulator [Delftia acidovorans]QPS06729.1 GntR family transcriptional regulator [Delftia acidovorans]
MAKRPFIQRLLMADADGGGEASRTLTEQAYAELRADIIEGRLVPGSKLRIEHLRQTYGVGAGTLREALTRLVSDALVTAEGQRGFRVSPIAIDDLEDLTRLRVHIETQALRDSIRHGGEDWRARLRASYEELSSLEQPLSRAQRRSWEMMNLRFHEALLAGQPSPWTQKVLRLLARHGERYRCYAMDLPGMTRDVHAEHTEIFELAMAGQEARAALALEAHICATPHELLKALREGRVRLPGTGGAAPSGGQAAGMD